MESLAEAFADLNKFLKKFKNTDSNIEKSALRERNAHGALSAYKSVMKRKETNQTIHHGHISEKSDIHSRRNSDGSFRRCSRRNLVITGDDSSIPVNGPEHLSVGQDVEVEEADVDDPDPV